MITIVESERNESRQRDAKETDRTIKFCTKCKRCWQKAASKNLEHKDMVEYFQEFPKIGKEKKDCYECKNIRTICDICDKDVPRLIGDLTGVKAVMVPNIFKRDGIWICKSCDEKYPI